MPKIIEIFRQEILELRRSRDSKFLFVPKTRLSLLARVFLLEVCGFVQKADKYLIYLVLNDLIEKRVLSTFPVSKDEFTLGELTYFDIRLKTFDGDIYCRGTSTNLSEAYAKALGEVFERFTLKTYKDFTVKKLSVQEMGAIERDYPQPTKEQKQKLAHFQIRPTDVFTCIEAIDEKTGDKKWLSVQAFSLNHWLLKGSKLLVGSTTNGAGAGYSLEQANESGLLEIMHRHVFLNSWFQKEVYPKIVPDETDPIFRNTTLYKKIVEFRRYGFSINWVNQTSKTGVPTVICVLEKMGGWYMGGASKRSLLWACERSLDEAMATYMWCCRHNQTGDVGYKNKKNLDEIGDGLTDKRSGSVFKITAFANSYFTYKFDKFFLGGAEEVVGFELLTKLNTDVLLSALPGKAYKYTYETHLLAEYNYFLTKYFVPQTIHFALDDFYTTPLATGLQEPKFTKINPFP